MIKEAIILCGGNGRRLAPYTDSAPKGMVPIYGSPILEYQVKWLKRHRVERIIFACGYRHEKIVEYFGSGAKWDLVFDYSIEEKPLGRGGSLKKAWGIINNEAPILVMNGDILTNLNLFELINFHEEHTGIATLCLFRYQSQYGVVILNKGGNHIIHFEEKAILPHWVSGGIYLFNYEIKGLLPEVGDHEMLLFPKLASEGKLLGYRSNSYWKAIDTVKDLEEIGYE